MLHFETITDKMLQLLTAIQSNPLFKKFRLVGGPSLALQMGHRKSIDLDFFGDTDLSNEQLSFELVKLGEVKLLQLSNAVKVYVVDGVKIDFVKYPYPWIQAPVVRDKFMLSGSKDIAAMKICYNREGQ